MDLRTVSAVGPDRLGIGLGEGLARLEVVGVGAEGGGGVNGGGGGDCRVGRGAGNMRQALYPRSAAVMSMRR